MAIYMNDNPLLLPPQTLSIRSCGDMGSGEPLSRLPSLAWLDASWCRSVTAPALVHIGPQLRTLRLAGCDLVDDLLCPLLHSVEHLNLAFTRVTDVGLRQLAQSAACLNLLVLADQSTANLWNTGLWTQAGLAEFRASRPTVKVEFVFC